MKQPFQATVAANRIESLDALRGLALFGILLANMLLFHTPMIYLDAYSWFTSPSDQEAFRNLDIFIEGSFYPIFATLFGYGIAMQFEKTQQNNQLFAPTMARRYGILVVFGLIHGIFIWTGDILFPYAIMGFLMIAFIRLPAKWLLILGTSIYVLATSGIFLLMALLVKLGEGTALSTYADIHKIEQSIGAYSLGTYAEITAFRFQEWLLIGVANGVLMGFFIVLPLIMIGAAFGKYRLFEKGAPYRGRFISLAIVFIGLGLVMKTTPYYLQPTAEWVLLQDSLGGATLAFGYIFLFLVLYEMKWVQKVLHPVRQVGRMSLTIYIMQSVIATLIFYSYGFGLYGKIDVMTGVWIAVGIYAFQLIFAELWFMKFKMGPLEKLWRKGTYRTKPSK